MAPKLQDQDSNRVTNCLYTYPSALNGITPGTANEMMYYFNTMHGRGLGKPATRKLFHGLVGVNRCLGTDRKCARNWSGQYDVDFSTELSTKRDGTSMIRHDLNGGDLSADIPSTTCFIHSEPYWQVPGLWADHWQC